MAIAAVCRPAAQQAATRRFAVSLRDWQQFHNAAKDHREVCICAIREEL